MWNIYYAESRVTAYEWFKQGARFVICRKYDGSLIACFDYAQADGIFRLKLKGDK